MKNNFSRANKGYLAILLALMSLVWACQKTASPEAENSLNSETGASIEDRTNFSPSISPTIENGMFVFSNWQDFDQVLSEINRASGESVNGWESSIGFSSKRRAFSGIMAAEDAIDDYYSSLPEEQQAYYRTQPAVHSQQYTDGLSTGVIKLLTDPEDNSVYWDYNLADPAAAPLVNSSGLVKVEGKIIQFTQGTLVKVILDGDYNKVANLAGYTSPYQDATYWIFEPRALGGGPCLSNDWSKTNSWQYPNNKRRLKVELEGKALANFVSQSQNCYLQPYGTTCMNRIHTQAQKKNFWGNWVYSSSYGPSLTIDDGEWSYNYSLYNNSCSGSVSNYNSGLNGSGAVPLWDLYVPWTNNGYFNMNPNTSGWWIFSNPQTGGPKFIYCTINVPYYDIKTYYGPYGPSTWKIKKP